jgi:hypothetical protein
MQTFDPAVIEFTKQLQGWHASRVATLQAIVDHPEANIKLADIEIKAGSDIAKGCVLVCKSLCLNWENSHSALRPNG